MSNNWLLHSYNDPFHAVGELKLSHAMDIHISAVDAKNKENIGGEINPFNHGKSIQKSELFGSETELKLSRTKDKGNPLHNSTKSKINSECEITLQKRNQDESKQARPNGLLGNEEANLKKYISRIKYFWRGTNFTNPFVFVKVFKKEREESTSEELHTADRNLYCIEDLSKKRTNADK